jgi:hypothetical protein
VRTALTRGSSSPGRAAVPAWALGLDEGCIQQCYSPSVLATTRSLNPPHRTAFASRHHLGAAAGSLEFGRAVACEALISVNIAKYRWYAWPLLRTRNRASMPFERVSLSNVYASSASRLPPTARELLFE